ncbi:hypothetical protein GCU56_01415 [Geodermatophilus sabuli]|uniref:Uncharacterized protein n=1 Tax=Geodermatophilus sabuli TaxID=1564158 RepID=A0A7K3VWT5_9ACTN|nr:hypothetical protein [Geodermatophilus sabuli]NEK56533.1 hypothetical protein [Geodermatophilus sabuli]
MDTRAVVQPPSEVVVSPTSPRRGTPCRASLAGAVAVVLLTACGDGGDPDTPSSAAGDAPETGTTETAAPSGGADFCARAAELDTRIDAALSDADAEGDDPSVPDAFRQIAEELRAIDPPGTIRSDWEALASGLDRMADAFADFDITDSESFQALDDAEGDLSTAGSNVETYLRDECGIEP